jgi:hypothetical protein
MKLLTNEHILVSSDKEKVILTNQRIQLNNRSWGQAYSINIFLEDISSVETKYRSYLILVLLGLISVAGGVYLAEIEGSESLYVGFALGGFFLLVWWLTRTNVISITPNGGSSLNFVVKGMSDDKITDFVFNVSQAKLDRVNQLN